MTTKPYSSLNRWQLRFIYIVFIISGFAGLIYESVWSHYLKLYLGHAAYAQTLVLVIFMGGMALGAWITSKYASKFIDLLKVYAVCELIIGLFGLFFHDLYVTSTEYSYTTILPALDSPILIDGFKWLLAALLIVMQSIILGSTFPLMSAGIIRRIPTNPGAMLSILYFSNSIGAAMGVLVAGFILIELFGLPGTVQLAGYLNLMVAAAVLILLKLDDRWSSAGVSAANKQDTDSDTSTNTLLLLLLCALFTGAASFIYEIGWIRMLSLVVGSSTHAFELMLSAFILGLAIGGLWIKRRIDHLKNPLFVLAVIQIAMGLLAALTLLIYNSTFDLTLFILKALDTTVEAYNAFNLLTHALAMLVMLPATICAGMTLPLITYILLSKGTGETAIGRVYAANTLGAILGIILAVQVLLPTLGLKNLIAIGAGIDILVGLGLFWSLRKTSISLPLAKLSASSLVLYVVILSLAEFDAYKMSSGIYRRESIHESVELLFHRDGKTASVDLIKLPTGSIAIKTNGKTDVLVGNHEVSMDEPTMILAAALPLAINPDVRDVAVIGLGSGLSSNTALMRSNVELVDTIEIEPAVVEAARGFGERVSSVFNDPRSHIHIEDAKTFFTSRKKTYDVIISEPSNPWVSGIASLFSQEFYRQAKRHLNPEGLFVQWMHLYEIDVQLLASVMKALAAEFNSYSAYFTTDADILFIASERSSIKDPGVTVFDDPALRAELERIEITSLDEILIRKLGSKPMLSPLFAGYSLPANSDFHPWLDLNAAKTRFMDLNASELTQLITTPLPLHEVLDSRHQRTLSVNNKGIEFSPSKMALEASLIRKYYAQGHIPDRLDTNVMIYALNDLRTVQSIHYQCEPVELEAVWLPTLHSLISRTMPYLDHEDMLAIFTDIESAQCYSKLPTDTVRMVKLYKAIVERDFEQVIHISAELIPQDKIPTSDKMDFVVKAAALSYIALGKRNDSIKLLNRYLENVKQPDIVHKLLQAHSQTRSPAKLVKSHSTP